MGKILIRQHLCVVREVWVINYPFHYLPHGGKGKGNGNCKRFLNFM